MNFSIKQNKLMEHLNYVIKGVSSKNLIPILNCIHLELKQEGLYLSSTDNEIAIKTFLPAQEIESLDQCGQLVVSGRYLYDIIRKLPGSQIHIEVMVDNKVSITTESSSFQLNCNNADEFPNLELEDHKNPMILTEKMFKNLVTQTAFAASLQESRPVLTGINLKIEGSKLECTATDSYRLAQSSVILETGLEETVNVIIPTKNLLELTRMFSEEDSPLEIHIFNNKIIFKFQTIILLSRLINGTYPDISKLIPDTFLLEVKTKLSDFFSAIDRASLLTNESDKNTIKLESHGNEIVISSHIPEIGNVEEKVSVEKDKEEEIKIAFSSKYMMEAIKVLDCDEISLFFNGEVKPIIIKNKENDQLLQLILPIRTY